MLYDGLVQRERAEWEAAQRVEQARARQAAIAGALKGLPPLAPAIQCGDVAAMKRAASILRDAYGLQVQERE